MQDKSFKAITTAAAAFEEKFKQQTGNKWSDRRSFKKKPSKYGMVDLRPVERVDSMVALETVPCAKAAIGSLLATDEAAAAAAESELPEPVAQLMAKMFDAKELAKQMSKSGVDLARLPLGRISRATVIAGYKVLNTLEIVLKATKAKSMDPAVVAVSADATVFS